MHDEGIQSILTDQVDLISSATGFFRVLKQPLFHWTILAPWVRSFLPWIVPPTAVHHTWTWDRTLENPTRCWRWSLFHLLNIVMWWWIPTCLAFITVITFITFILTFAGDFSLEKFISFRMRQDWYRLSLIAGRPAWLLVSHSFFLETEHAKSLLPRLFLERHRSTVQAPQIPSVCVYKCIYNWSNHTKHRCPSLTSMVGSTREKAKSSHQNCFEHT